MKNKKTLAPDILANPGYISTPATSQPRSFYSKGGGETSTLFLHKSCNWCSGRYDDARIEKFGTKHPYNLFYV